MKKETIILLATLLILASVAYAETEPLLTRGDGRIILGLSNEVGLLRLRSTGSESSPQLILEDLDRVGVARLRTIDGDVFIEKSPDNQPFQSRIALTDDNTISLDNQNGNIILLPNGDVGIGTLIPEARLDVIGDILAGTTNSMTRLGSRGLELIGPTYEVGLVPNTDGSFGLTDDRAGVFRLLIDPIGNIGIGTVTPNKKLHVVGTTQSDDGILIGSDESDGNILLTNAAKNANRVLHFRAEDTGPITSQFEGDLSVSDRILFGNGLGRLSAKDNLPQIQLSDTQSLATLNIQEGVFTLTGTPLRVPTLQLGDAGSTEVVWNIQEEENHDLTYKYVDEKLRITAQGNVGIGTSTPARPLTIKSEQRQLALVDTAGANSAVLETNTAMFKIQRGSADGGTFEENLLQLNLNTGDLNIKDNLNLGGLVGSLHLEHSKTQENFLHINPFGSHPGVKVNQNVAKPFDVNNGKFRVAKNGNVAIASKLDVGGNTAIQGNTKIQGTLHVEGKISSDAQFEIMGYFPVEFGNLLIFLKGNLNGEAKVTGVKGDSVTLKARMHNGKIQTRIIANSICGDKDTNFEDGIQGSISVRCTGTEGSTQQCHKGYRCPVTVTLGPKDGVQGIQLIYTPRSNQPQIGSIPFS